ncbi:hypothetical protein VPNG_08535 [Cytospora leucostoma]|uniref:Cytochrome P450 n=1 Tax=Cytospora leucostoma TaxID=1230097 RepID=A0A423W567_9PEZI|nr:hypothetical protein VPNG_08535 [Cytospora leucostoma]
MAFLIVLVVAALLLLSLRAWPFTWLSLRAKPLPPGMLIAATFRRHGKCVDMNPGPPTLPFLGNLHQIPPAGIHLKYTNWAKNFGSKFTLKVGSGTMVVLSSAVDAGRVMDKHSVHSSNRPPSYIIGDLVFEGKHPMFMNADERWKLRRKLYYQMLQESVCDKQHLALVEAESAQLLRDICLDPNDFFLHPGRMSNSIMMSMVFGIRTPKHNSPHYLKQRQVMSDLSALGEIGATPPVEIFPFLKFLPEGLWGNWKTRAHLLRKSIFGLYGPMVDSVLERRASGIKIKSFLDGVLDQQEKLQLDRHEIDIMCGNLLEGGTDTMATLILTLLQAMALHPHIQEEAQAHIDSVLDGTRMPSWADYKRLPYVAMVVKELHRWRSPAPAGFPHALDKGSNNYLADEEIDGFKIPKNSAVIINIWGIHNDATRYADPEEFNPRRFEAQTEPASVYANSSDYKNRDHYGYGIGRRICPGIHLAERGLWLATARILWAYTIRPKIDLTTGEPGHIDVGPETGYTDGFLNQCKPFDVEVTPRSQERKDILLAEAGKAEAEIFSAFTCLPD